jgi:hypothetical protein
MSSAPATDAAEKPTQLVKLDSLRHVQQPTHSVRFRELKRPDTFLVKHPIVDPEPGVDWRAILTDVAFLFLLTVLGVGFLFGGAIELGQTSPPFVNLFADVFFGAGFTPFVFNFWAFVTAPGSRAIKGRRKQDLVRVVVSLVWVAVGMGMISVASAPLPYGAVMLGVFGGAMVEIVVLIAIQKFFWFAEDDAKVIQRLEETVEQLRTSASYGLALSYFYNFVLPICSHLRVPAENNGVTPIDIEIGKNQFSQGELTDSSLYILVPRNLEAGADIKATLRAGTDDKVLQSGKPQPLAGAPPSHRPMFIFFVKLSAASTMHAVDIPTVLSSIRDRADAAKKQAEANRQNGVKQTVVQVDIEREIHTFTNALLELVQGDERARQLVHVLMVPSMPFNHDVLPLLDIDALRSGSVVKHDHVGDEDQAAAPRTAAAAGDKRRAGGDDDNDNDDDDESLSESEKPKETV